MNVVPYIKIDSKYLVDNQLQNCITPCADEVYCTTNYNLEHFSNENIIYLSCYNQNNSFLSLLKDYSRLSIIESLTKKMNAQYRAITQINVPLEKAHKFIPAQLFTDFNGELLQAIMHAFSNNSQPRDYTYLRYALGIAEYIKKHPIKHKDRIIQIRYNPFTSYGRFGLLDKSYNILSDTLESRKYINPITDEFELLELDFNAFEIRVLLALCKIKQPQEDLYSVLHKQQDHLSRKEFKQNLIASLYSNHPERTPLHNIIRKKFLRERFPIKNNVLTNIFGKSMDCEEYYYYTRLIQSTAAYVFFQQVWNIISYLSLVGYKSQVAFCIHDSVCIQIHKSEMHLLDTIKEILSNIEIKELNYQDKFPVKLKLGQNYSLLKEQQ